MIQEPHPEGGDAVLTRISRWKARLLYSTLGLLLLPGLVSLAILEAGLIPKAFELAFPDTERGVEARSISAEGQCVANSEVRDALASIRRDTGQPTSQAPSE